jgi:hypothetical protein
MRDACLIAQKDACEEKPAFERDGFFSMRTGIKKKKRDRRTPVGCADDL